MIHFLTNSIDVFAAISAGMLAGIYFIFSNTVIPALANIATNSASNVMQLINHIILNPLFLFLFMGSALASLVIVLLTIFRLEHSNYHIGFYASLLVIASFVSTLIFNVPLNNLLDINDIHTDVTNETWSYYLDNWVVWNHVRAWLTFLAAILFEIELLV